MAKKKKHEEHENLERWLVSYSDFMTLLFATFVVLYALSQSDVNSFKSIEEALRRAFSQNVFDAQQSILTGQDSILEGQSGANNPLMLEYMSQKYEQSSYDEVKSEIEKLNKEGVNAIIEERGLVIRLNDRAVQFTRGTAELSKNSLKVLDAVAAIIKQKFAIHYIQVEGHTDSDKIHTLRYPSNWELSSARASSVIRYLIQAHNFTPKIFIAEGLSDTVPIVENTTPENKAKNRRVEIVVLRNKNRNLSQKDIQEILKEARKSHKKTTYNTSKQIEGLVGKDKELLENVIDMTNRYEKENDRLKSLDEFDYIHDGTKPDFME